MPAQETLPPHHLGHHHLSPQLATEVSPPEEYFRGVSPLCRRMLDDMTAVREKFGETWNELSYQQQCRVIDQAMVDEATVRRYEAGDACTTCEDPEFEYFPKLKLPTGQKVVCDENLTARGISCSWRDEHSAPFSWHTRSQMDLTLDTPPATPTHPGTPTEAPPTSVEGQGRVIPGGRAVYSARPVSLPKPPRFRWHYDPPDSPDPPAVVVAAPRSATLPSDLNRQTRKGSPSNAASASSPSKYLLIRNKDGGESGGGGGGGSGILARIRGAVAALTATCLPLKATTNSLVSLYNAPKGGGEPELRPPHVRAQGKDRRDPRRDSPTENRDSEASDANGNPKGFISNPLSELATDPALVGYYCTLPDEDADDDMPYTPRAALLPDRAKGKAPRTPELEASYRPVPEGAPAPLRTPETSESSIPSGLTSSLSACLPTPVPTPTASDVEKPALGAKVEGLPSAKDSSRRPTEAASVRKTSDGEHDLLEEFNLNLELTAAQKRESNIPKTGFDFLDNW